MTYGTADGNLLLGACCEINFTGFELRPLFCYREPTMVTVKRLNHAVLFVRDLERSIAFYESTFGFETIARERGTMAFLRAKGSHNHHDLGLAAVGPAAPDPPRGAVGLYHTAWEVERIEDLREAMQRLTSSGALTGASDHGATKSVYGVDPDGNEFELMWMVPREHWGEYERSAPTKPLDVEREIARFGKDPPVAYTTPLITSSR
jgi:catechol-2,3-dioxygenase